MYVDHVQANLGALRGRARGRHCRLGEIASSLPVVAALRTVQGLVTANFSAVARPMSAKRSDPARAYNPTKQARHQDKHRADKPRTDSRLG